MHQWLDRLTGRRERPAQDSRGSLKDYVPFRAPHVGAPAALSTSQLEANLAHLVLHRGERLSLLGDWLRAHAGIDIRPALLGGDLPPLLAQLNSWARTQWPSWHHPAHRDDEAWQGSSRDGPDLVFSLLLDVALLLGELIMSRHAGYRWALDLDPRSERDQATTWRRIVLKLPRTGDMPCDIDLDLERMVVGRYLRPGGVVAQLIDPWAETVMSAATGAQEAVWLGPTAGR